MAGIYIHIPFCKQACSYCNFHFSTTAKNRAKLISAINQELIVRKSYLDQKPIKTIYFGGGTPSLLSGNELKKIFDTIEHHYMLEQLEEVTLEANPDDLDVTKLKELRSLPINRSSIGVQSFFKEDLQFMNRAHSSDEALSSIKRAQDYGFENLSIDLIYGIPGSNEEKWEKNLQLFFDLDIPHLSSYALTVEEKTALAHQIAKGEVKAPLEDELADQYDLLQEYIKSNQWVHYELSNYSKLGHEAIHNSSYWEGIPYLGIGPSAHSYNGASRQWNIANNHLYSKSNFQNDEYYEVEMLNEKERYHDALISRMRTEKGISWSYLRKNFSRHTTNHFIKELEKLEDFILTKGDTFKIREEYWLTSDEILSRLMLED